MRQHAHKLSSRYQALIRVSNNVKAVSRQGDQPVSRGAAATKQQDKRVGDCKRLTLPQQWSALKTGQAAVPAKLLQPKSSNT
jgi:hypothetical protein